MKIFVGIFILLNILACPDMVWSQSLRVPLGDSAVTERHKKAVEEFLEKFLSEFRWVKVSMLGMVLPQANGVYPPNKECTEVLVKVVLNKINMDDIVLDMGCGSGVICVKIARDKGCTVHGVDNNDDAVLNSKLSAIIGEVSDKVKIWKSNGFMDIPEGNKYDAIVFNSSMVVSMAFGMSAIFDRKGKFVKHVLDNFAGFLTTGSGRMYMMGVDVRALRKILRVYRDRLHIFVFDEQGNKRTLEDFYSSPCKVGMRVYEIFPEKWDNIAKVGKKGFDPSYIERLRGWLCRRKGDL